MYMDSSGRPTGRCVSAMMCVQSGYLFTDRISFQHRHKVLVLKMMITMMTKLRYDLRNSCKFPDSVVFTDETSSPHAKLGALKRVYDLFGCNFM